MPDQRTHQDDDRHNARRTALRFTPAEWRLFLEDESFLSDHGNSYAPPRRLMGVYVEIVPDHRFG